MPTPWSDTVMLICDRSRVARNGADALEGGIRALLDSGDAKAIDAALMLRDFVQLPVRPEPQPHSRWIAAR